MVGLSSNGNTNCGASLSRNRIKCRISSKAPSPLTNIPEDKRQNIGIGELNRQISDLKMESCTQQNQQVITDVNKKLANHINSQTRRDSNNSTTSSYYCSMRSNEMSRRSSQNSQISSISTMRRNNFNSASFYDPISPGSSRRSSQISMNASGGQSLPPPPSSHLLSNHQFTRPHTGRLSHPNVSENMFAKFNDRRLSEPTISQNNEANNTFENETWLMRDTKKSVPKPKNPTKLHPNEEVLLDEMEEGEMVENKLVIPDEMLQYLNQVNDLVQNGQSHPKKNNLNINFENTNININTDFNNQNLDTQNCCGWDQLENFKTTDREQKDQNTNIGNYICNNGFLANNETISGNLCENNQFGNNTNNLICNEHKSSNSPDNTTSYLACNCLPGYYHKTNNSAENCCLNLQALISNQNNPNLKNQFNEIQCDDISQSQASPSSVTPQTPNASNMRLDVYQRTLEYVQNCQTWVDNNIVSSSTHPSSNMIINDMSTSLYSFQQENKFLQMIQ